jgi:GTP pyrophosphokinase
VYPVLDVSVKPVEFQIRTERMHREAEYGVAAHWLYKNHAEAEAEDRRQLEWLRELLPLGESACSHAEFINRLHRQVYDNRLVVLQGARQPRRLPANATVRDLIERLGQPSESEVIVRVDGTPQPPDYPLQDGDSVDLSILAGDGEGAGKP